VALVPRPWLYGGIAAIVVGVLLAAVGDGTVDVVGFAVGGAGVVALTGLAFYAVGRSEDRDRQQRPHG
jgi:hypothetical protein